jgi:hypothetical protein
MPKYKTLRSEMDFPHVLGGGLEPHFRVLFSAVFQGIALEKRYSSRKHWKAVEAKLLQVYVRFFCWLYPLKP